MASTAVAVVAFLIIAAAASVVFAEDPNNPGYGGMPTSLALTASSTNRATGLSLELALNATTVKSGQAVDIMASETNTLPTMNNVTASNQWPVKGLAVFESPCGTVNHPFGMALYRGYYGNVSLAKPLQLYAPEPVYHCPMILSKITQYSFYPENSTAQIWGSCVPGPCQTFAMFASLPVKGYWNTGFLSDHTALIPGVYTVAAGNEWGQLELLYFVVRA